MDLMYLIYSLLRKKWIIIFCTVLGIAAGLIFTLFRKPMYVSFAKFSTGFTMQKQVQIKQEESFNIYEIDLRFNNVIETFQAPTVLGMLSYNLLLHDLEDTRPFRRLTESQLKNHADLISHSDKIRQILRRKIAEMRLVSPYDVEEKRAWDLIRLYDYDEETLSKKLTVNRVLRSDFIDIFFRSENPELSAYVVNTIGEQFMRFFNYVYGVRTQDAKSNLDSLTNAKKREVDSLTAKMRILRDAIGTPNVGDRASAAMTVVQEVTANLQKEQANLNNLEGELNAVDDQLQTLINSPQVTVTNNNAEIVNLQKKNRDLESEKAGASPQEVTRLEGLINENEKRILQLGSSNTPNRTRDIEKRNTRRDELVSRKIELEQQINAAKRNVRLFSSEKNRYERITETGGGDEVVVRAKDEELRIANSEYSTLKQSLQASADADVNPVNSFKQLNVGQPAYKPEPSRRGVILALSGLAMMFLSSFVILLLEFLDSSFKTPSIFQRATNLKLLSTVNKVDFRKRELTDYFHNDGLSNRDEDQNIFVENLRKLRYELEKTGKKIFLVTSTKPREGKTTIIESLANSMSLARKKILVIDANFSNNTITQKYNAKPSLEAFSVNGQSNPLERFGSSVTTSSIPNTDVVGCKEGNYTPSEVLPKNNMMENLKKIGEQYDFIFVEGAALNTNADSKELSRYVEGIVVVFSARSILRQTDKESIQYLKSNGDKFVGSVLNYVEEENLDL
ncbi:MAG TPA: Wzz/FepE/Etk N-terminal domain-containing protein [Flavitalea sp.]|nr:Wzz/FepE/Etk N-terminal domain-containing protein [Flavitalea sp.]